MSAGDLAAVLVSLVMIAAIVVIAVVTGAMLRTLRELRATLEVLRGEVVPLMGELRDTVSAAGAEVDRVDDLLDTAEAISATVEGASRVGYLAFRAPLIRVVALGRGMRRGAGHLFLRRPAPAPEPRSTTRSSRRRDAGSRSRAA